MENKTEFTFRVLKKLKEIKKRKLRAKKFIEHLKKEDKQKDDSTSSITRMFDKERG
jgi:hypothetical protein